MDKRKARRRFLAAFRDVKIPQPERIYETEEAAKKDGPNLKRPTYVAIRGNETLHKLYPNGRLIRVSYAVPDS